MCKSKAYGQEKRKIKPFMFLLRLKYLCGMWKVLWVPKRTYVEVNHNREDLPFCRMQIFDRKFDFWHVVSGSGVVSGNEGNFANCNT